MPSSPSIDLGWFEKLPGMGAQGAYDELTACAKLRRWEPGTMVCKAGDAAEWLCAIQSGTVEVRLSNAPRTLRLTVLGPGQIWGEMGVVGFHRRRTAEVHTLHEVVEARLILVDDLDRIRRRHPAVDRVLVEVLAERVRRLSGDIATLTLLPSTREMVRRWVLDRAARDADGIVRANQQAVGESLGLSRYTVSDYLRDDIAAGRVETARLGRSHVLRVPDTLALQEAIEADAGMP
ncbi:MAG: Crp/Fnr family transcriptional regulator [Frankiales bacterium]|nr:Crp/Fnr family transcriptional regulator [Frankiales bacterium]